MNKTILIALGLLFTITWTFAYTSKQIESAHKLANQWVISQQNDGNDYRLDDNITRKEFMKVVAKITKEQIEEMCEKKFNDVAADWWCKYIEWALRKNFIATNSTFRPNNNITKAESMKLILKARSIVRVQNTSDWRDDDMVSAAQNGILEYKYYDYNTFATRWWIFDTMATNLWTYSAKEPEKKDDTLWRNSNP